MKLKTFDGGYVDYFETIDELDNIYREIKLAKAIGKDTAELIKQRDEIYAILDYNGICGI